MIIMIYADNMCCTFQNYAKNDVKANHILFYMTKNRIFINPFGAKIQVKIQHILSSNNYCT